MQTLGTENVSQKLSSEPLFPNIKVGGGKSRLENSHLQRIVFQGRGTSLPARLSGEILSSNGSTFG